MPGCYANKIRSYSLCIIIFLVALTWIDVVLAVLTPIKNLSPLYGMTLFPILISIIACFGLYIIYRKTPLSFDSPENRLSFSPRDNSCNSIIAENNAIADKLQFQAHLLENVQESIMVINSDGEIVYYNEQAKNIFNFPSGETSINIISLPWEQDKINHCLLSGRIGEEEGRLVVQGVEKTFIHRYHPLYRKNDGMELVVISTDISELVEIRSHAEIANIAKSQFLANMTHELRTPMIGIMGSVDLLEQSHLDQEQLENVYVIQECSKQLLDIINEILDVSKIELGIEQLHPSPTNLSDILYRTTSIMEAMLRDKGLLLEINIDPYLPPVVMIDQLKLRQVLVNILYNAIKFTHQGGIKIEARLQQNLFDSHWLLVSVADTGIGIPQDKLQSIFECFSQADNSACREFGGTGLGLYICKKHIGLMSGEIWAESQDNSGSTFYFRIPLDIVDQAHDINTSIQPLPIVSEELPGEFAPISVLIVEDNELNQKLLSQMLLNYGFEVSTVLNGLECLNTLQYNDFDIILMDMQMPVMDGYEATRLIRENSLWDHMPVIAITANAMNGDREKCLACGCSSYLAKPFKSDDLIQEIKFHLKAGVVKKKVAYYSSNQLISDLIPEFIELMGEMLSELEKAIESKDLENIQNIGHAIKGTAGMYGFMNMSDLAACIEQTAREKAAHKLPRLFNQIKTLFQQVSKPMCSKVIG